MGRGSDKGGWRLEVWGLKEESWRERLSVNGDMTYGTMFGPATRGQELAKGALAFMKREEKRVIPFHIDRARSAVVAFMAVAALSFSLRSNFLLLSF